MFKKFRKNLSGLFKLTLSEKNTEKVLEDLKYALIKNDVGLIAAEKIVENTQLQMMGEKVGAFSKKGFLKDAVKSAIGDLLKVEDQFDLLDRIV